MTSKTKIHLLFFAALTFTLLLVPLIAMQFTNEVNWTVGDFIFATILLFGSGVVYEIATYNLKNPQHRVYMGFIVFGLLFIAWVAAATG